MAAAHYLAMAVGCVFILAGLVKLIPLDPEQQGHGLPEMSKDFERFYTVLPLRGQLGIIKTPTMYMTLIGVAESLLGAILAFGRSGYRACAALELLGIMIGAFYTLRMVGDPFLTVIPSTVLGSALVYIFLNRHQLNKSSAKAKTS